MMASLPTRHFSPKPSTLGGMSNEILYLAAYDISSPVRLRQALHVLLDYAMGRQKSVFECPLNPADRQELLERISDILDPREDRFALVRMGQQCASHTLGRAVPLPQGSFYYIG